MHDSKGLVEPEPGGPSAGEQLEAVVALERELTTRGRWRMAKLGAGVLLVVAAVMAVRIYRQRAVPAPPSPFVTAPVEVRDVVESIESSGKLRPLIEVKVGTQVSGRVVRVLADFNLPVKKGDLLAEIDPSLFGAQVSQVAGQLGSAQAQLERARAAEESARTIYERLRRLNKDGLASQADLEKAEMTLRVASADTVSIDASIRGLRAQLASANTTLAYTKIYSPIDGIVIERAVDPGQTVAANFAAPVLFVIARDLSEMQVLADVDEADVGKVREGMAAVVRVDAFPDQRFAGKVIQIRYNPTDVQGVVTYAAAVDVRNDELNLRPGMTVTVTITTQKAQGVPAVRNAALRFKPTDPKAAGPNAELEPGHRRVYLLERNAGGGSGAGRPSDAAPAPLEKLEPRVVHIGVSDGIWTELKDRVLPPGAQVVTEQRASKEQGRAFLGLF